ncbi:PH domain-containing protein [Candidatus Saccharibacteria bacterium]|jgi:uncharacterized membrane protein YdbT with pleckstrin-like domain|nr:PH domain-containing protein [Candidatus Saccharibacteria bacterium]
MVKESEAVFWHGKLPIGKDEEILGIYKHHWFVYVQIWLMALVAVLAILGVTVLLTSSLSDADGTVAAYRPAIVAGAVLLSSIIVLFSIIPAWLRSQERLILTEESLLQVLQPGILANKVSQLSLQHVADVSVRQDFLGHIFGYGHLTVETPGEQDNYEFAKLGGAQMIARDIIEAHENFDAALQSGRVPTTFGSGRQEGPQVQINANEYEQFMAFRAMQNKANADAQSSQLNTPEALSRQATTNNQLANNGELPKVN